MKAIRYISFFLFAAVYFAASCAVMLCGIEPSYTGAGRAAFATQTAHPKDVPRKIIVQRRHIPLVKPLTIPVETACPVKDATNHHGHAIVLRPKEERPPDSFKYSSLRDRSPPIA